MITLNNSNIDFDIESSNSILVSNSNFIFRTNTLNRMTILENGNVGIGLDIPTVPLEIVGNFKSSGMITSTGAGFTGRGDYLTNIPLEGLPLLNPTFALLRGDTSNYASKIEQNIYDTSNILVNRVLLETDFGSNYTSRINSELNTRTDNTSNYILSTSNILVQRIRNEIDLTSNYVLSASNNLINKIRENDNNSSNYILTASNNLINKIRENDYNSSNYILTASNNLINKIRENDNNSSNYILTASNNLINKIKENDNNSSNYILTASNNLINKIKENDNNSSNYILTASNNLINKIRENDNNSSNYILTASNNLVNRANLNDSNSSNYVSRITSFLIDYNNLINRPDGTVTANNANQSNYLAISSNILVERIVEEVGRGSNYTLSSSNNLVNRVVAEVGRGSNYTLSSSNNLVNRVIEEVGRGSNYTLYSSNNLVNRVVEEVGRGSNYTIYSSNNLVNRVVEEVGRGSNYTIFSSNNLVNRVISEVGFGSNYTDKVGGFGSNYTDKVGIFGSNYTDKVGIFGSNYILSTSNILVGRILTEVGFTSNYTKRLNDIAMVSSQWTTDSTTIFYNSGNIGIGTVNPVNNLHIYSCNNTNIASAKLTIQEANTCNIFSAYPSDIISVPVATITASIPSTIDKYMIFTYTTDNTGTGQTQYAITLPENYSCDILMVGGGGGGGGDIGGGGGGGAVLYGSNIIIPAGSYNIKVGAGGSGTGQNGYNTEGFGSICLGGGGAKNIPWESSGTGGANNGNMGGSGGGGKSYNTTGGPAGAGGAVGISTKSSLLAAAILYNGNVGGAGSQLNNGDTIQSGGGGGTGTAGGSGKSLNNSGGTGHGGDGVLINVLNIAATSNVYWGAGGGGAGYFSAAPGNGGLGGGGAGTRTFTFNQPGIVGAWGYSAASGMNAGVSTGSGGGGGAGQGSANYPSNGGNGGSGIIIIRYRQLINMKGTPEMQLVIGNTISSGGSNYKIGNYNGDFQIKTSTSNVDTTSLIIQNTANVGVGTNVITSKLHLYDSTSNAIFTIQDNTSIATLIAPTNITASVVTPATLSATTTSPTSFVKQLVLAYTADSSGFTGQTSYTLTIPEDINVDILVVAGGGAGGFFGGGGGGGQVLLTTNYNIAAGTSITVNVGKGGTGNSTAGTNGQNGFNSSITIAGTSFIANGGGGGGSRSGTSPFNAIAGTSGGSGGGSSTGDVAPFAIGGAVVENTYTNWRSFGYNGGIGSFYPGSGNANHYAGGGGGAGRVGGTGIYFNNTVATGGDGVDLSTIFGTSVGANNGFFGGGGGGINSGTTTTTPSGGFGGGGKGATSAVASDPGTSTTGGGGGGNISSAGSNGGSGVVIIRYRQRNREGNAEIQLIKGTSITAGYTNYKLGNYGGDFQIKSSLLGNDTNRLSLTAGGNVTLSGSMNATSYLLNGAPFSIATEVGHASNYVLSTSNNIVTRLNTEVSNSSNYSVLIGGFGSNYARDKIGIWGSNYADLIGGFTSNYARDKIGIWGSNYADLIGGFTSNYARDKIGIWSSNYTDLVGGFGSNYARDKIGVWGSNYTDLACSFTSNFARDKVGIWSSNYADLVALQTSNYILSTSNYLINYNNLINKPTGGGGGGGSFSISQGMVVQTKHLTYTLMDVKDNAGWDAINDNLTTGYVIAITPTNSLSKVLINIVAHIGVDLTGFSMWWGLKLYRKIGIAGAWTEVTGANGTETGAAVGTGGNPCWISQNIGALAITDTDGTNMSYSVANVSGTYLDSPLTNATTYYTLYWNQRIGDNPSTTGGIYLNRVATQTNAYRAAPSSSITASEIWDTGAVYVPPSSVISISTGGNVGIGTGDAVNKLHIYSSNDANIANSKLTIQEFNSSNFFSSYATNITSVPTVSSTSVAGTIDKYMIFTYTGDNTGTGQTQYSITLPESYSCDILMVGGGGGGGGDLGGGGGGGAVLYGTNIMIPGGTYNIKVGAGGNGGNGNGQNGFNTEGFGSICLGGGAAKNKGWNSAGTNDGNAGGSGGGGKSYNSGGSAGAAGASGTSTKGLLLTSATLYNGNAGGAGSHQNGGIIQSGGGGGTGAVGGSAKSGTNTGGTGAGGAGVAVNITGTSLFWGAGGGGAGFLTPAGNGGNGGGGAGTGSGSGGTSGTAGLNAINAASGMNAGAGSGSGGGGGSFNFQSNGGNGGSGIIIIRYRQLISMKGTPEMQLVIGNSISSGGSNYKIGNYNGDFQIKTSTSNVDTTSLIIQNTANVGVGTSVITSKLHLYDNNSNAIFTIQDNTSIATLAAPTTIATTVVSPATTGATTTSPTSFEKQLVLTYTADSTGFTGQTSYTLTITEDINADILVVAGGGAGVFYGGGGGAGQVLVTTNYNIAAGTSITVNVGKGGLGNNTASVNGQNGFNSSITIAGSAFIANGGGGGGSFAVSTLYTVAGSNGGSGGGSSSGVAGPASLGGVAVENFYTNWRSFGNNGGIGSYVPPSSTDIHFGGGGGGAGNVGGTAIYSTNTAAAGGVGVDLSSIFGTSVGANNGFFGGGGGGMSYSGTITGGAGGFGGGGAGATFSPNTPNGTPGTANTGGGGGGAGVLTNLVTRGTGGSGGTGVVIIRYRQRNREGNAEIQLIKGASISAGNTNYKIGNYAGDLKIKSSILSTDTDRFIIQNNGVFQFNNASGTSVATISSIGDLRTAGSQISNSDNRIKKDIEDINDSNALEMILAVKPKTYKYVDEERGASRIYGFIAQQIRNIIPEATEIHKDFLPNIMKSAICNKNRVYLDLTEYADLPLNEDDRRINIRFKNGGGDNFYIIEVNKEYFVIEKKVTNNYGDCKTIICPDGEVFVYGYEVKDFHKLTKDYIFTLNVSATQELHRHIETQNMIIKSYGERIKELEEKIELVLR